MWSSCAQWPRGCDGPLAMTIRDVAERLQLGGGWERMVNPLRGETLDIPPTATPVEPVLTIPSPGPCLPDYHQATLGLLPAEPDEAKPSRKSRRRAHAASWSNRLAGSSPWMDADSRRGARG